MVTLTSCWLNTNEVWRNVFVRQVRLWTLSVGHTVGFAVLFTKTWRVYLLCSIRQKVNQPQHNLVWLLHVFKINQSSNSEVSLWLTAAAAAAAAASRLCGALDAPARRVCSLQLADPGPSQMGGAAASRRGETGRGWRLKRPKGRWRRVYPRYVGSRFCRREIQQITLREQPEGNT